MKLTFLQNESYKKGIVFSTALNLLSKFLLFLQSVAIAYYFGTQATTDIFFYCFAAITLFAVFVNNLDTSVLIPEAMRLREQEKQQSATEFLSLFLYGYFIFGALTSFVFLIAPVKLFSLLSKFDPVNLEANKEVILLSIPLFTLMITANLMVNILASYKFFTIPMFLSSFNGIMALIMIMLFHNQLSIKSVLVGLLMSYSFNIVFLAYLMRTVLDWRFALGKVKIRNQVFKNIFYAQAGNITSVLTSYVPMYILSSFGSGIITSLTYGQKTAELPNQLITQQFSSVAGIKFNELYAQQKLEDLNRVFLSVVKLLLFILIPLSTLILIFSNNIVSILFERGRFDNSSVERSALFLKYFGLGLPMLAINTIIARLFMAAQKVKAGSGYQILLNSVLIIIITIGVRKWGPIGYPYAVVAIHVANLLFSYVLLKIVVPFINYNEVLLYTLKLLLLNGLVAALVYYLNSALFPSEKLLTNIVLGTTLYVSIILIVNYLTHLNRDLNLALQILTKFRKKL